MDELLTTQQVAKKLAVGPTSVKRWADSGRLAAVRTLGGHRRYTLASVLLLQQEEASAAPVTAVSAVGPPPPALDRVPAEHWRHPVLTQWLNLVANFDGLGLTDALTRAANVHGATAFLDDWAGPFLTAVGQLWAHGQLSIAQEHFASEYLHARLAAMMPANAGNGPSVLCATLPGELHVIGLQMAAVTARLAGLSVIFLGANLPVADLAQTAHDVGRRCDLRAVMVSISPAYGVDRARSHLTELQNLLPPLVALLVSGAGAPAGWGDGVSLRSQSDLRRWACEQLEVDAAGVLRST